MSVDLVYHKDDGGSSPFDLRAVEIAKSSHCLRIACPYLTFSYLERIVGLALDWELVTDILECLASMPAQDRLCFVSFIQDNEWRIRDLAGLHAKVLIGNTSAMVGSANFTISGMTHRTEMSVYFNETPEVAEAKTWFERLWENGIEIDLDRLDGFISELPEVHPINRRSAVTLAGNVRNTLLEFLPDLLHYKNAFGYYTGNGKEFCIKEGSFVKRDAEPLERNQPNYYGHRQRLIESGSLVLQEEHMLFKFTEDVLFDSSSEAASIVDGNSRSGPANWK